MDGLVGDALFHGGAVSVALWIAAIGGGAVLAARGLSLWWAREEARTDAFAAQADGLGLSFAATDVLHAAWEPFRLLGGRDPQVKNLVYGDWEGVELRAFEFSRAEETGAGASGFADRQRFSCVVAAVAASCPRLVVGSQAAVSRMTDLVDCFDVLLESEDFHRRFRVASEDRRFAFTLLDQRMMAWLLDLGERFAFEVHEDRILCFTEPTGPEGLRALLDATKGFHNHVPRVVGSMYPPRSMGPHDDAGRLGASG